MSPTGGIKDEIPPQLVLSVPAHNSINFSGNEVELIFNENIQLNNIKEQLLITPRIIEDLEYAFKKYTVTIKLPEKLEDSTTYSFNFRESIQDITEKNPAENLVLAFSTGPHLDSMSISGKVLNAQTHEPQEDVVVGIYAEDDTLDIFTGAPKYLTLTDKAGNYQLNNIKVGTYELVAVKDANRNLMAESNKEAYAFLSSPVQLDSATSDKDLFLTNLDIRDLTLSSNRQSGQYYEVKYNKSVSDYSISTANRDFLYSTLIDDSKTLKIYNTLSITDSLQIYIEAQDSIGNQRLDTLFLKYGPSSRKYDEFKSTLGVTELIMDNDILTTNLQFNKPILTFNMDSLFLKKDSLIVEFIDSLTTMTWDNTHQNLLISRKLPDTLKSKNLGDEKTITDKRTRVKPEKGATSNNQIELVLRKASFISIEQDSSKTLKKTVKPISLAQFGTLSGTVETEEKNYIIQLLNPNFDIQQEQFNLKKYEFKMIKPGNYLLRIVVDTNGNGKWDAGNILSNTPPETVIFHTADSGTKEFSVRQNWELGNIDLVF